MTRQKTGQRAVNGSCCGNGIMNGYPGLIALLALVSVAMMVSAAYCQGNAEASSSGTDGNINWTISGDTLTLSGNGPMDDYNSYDHRPGWESGEGWDGVTKVVIENGVSTIGKYAFYHCCSLASVTIPDSVTSIGEDAFEDCTSLASVTIPDSVTSIGDRAYERCTSLASVVIPDSVTSIGSYAFCDCTSLASVDLGSVTSIGSYAFWDCTSLASVDLGSVTSIGSYAFYGCTSLASVTIPDSVTSIGSHAFYGCTSLASVTIPDSVTSIGYYAFYHCYSLASATFGSSVTSIEDGAFYGCTKLASVVLPDSVVSIGYSVFEDCVSVTAVTVGGGLSSLGEYAFRHCISLESITVSPSNPSYSSDGGVLFDKDKTVLICYPAKKAGTAYSVPDGVATIRDSAFYDCNSLVSINIPASATSVNYAFYGCTSLESITVSPSNPAYSSDGGVLFDKDKTTLLTYPAMKADRTYSVPDSVTTISSSSFYKCALLETIQIPAGVTRINDSFDLCLVLKDINVADGNADYSSDRGILYDKGKTTLFRVPGMSGVTDLVIPDSVTKIDTEQFTYCQNLKTVSIPKSASFDDHGGYVSYFLWCPKLESVNVDGDNAALKSVGGVLFSKDGSKLMVYPAAKDGEEYTVPADVTQICYGAFMSASNLKRILVENGNQTYKSVGGAIYLVDQTESGFSEVLLAVPSGIPSFTVPEDTGVMPFCFMGDGLRELTVGKGSVLANPCIIDCRTLAKITVADGAQFDRGYDGSSQTIFLISGEQTIYIVQPEGYRIPPGCASDGIEIVYGEPVFTVTFDANGGTCDTRTKETGTDGRLASLPTASRDGYAFDGWYTQATGGEKISTSYVFSKDTTVYAHWTESPSPTPSSGGGIPVIAIIGAVIAIIVAAGAVVFIKKR